MPHLFYPVLGNTLPKIMILAPMCSLNDTGNIMVRDFSISGKINAGNGDIEISNIPAVTFIDFGHSTSNFNDDLAINIKGLIILMYHKNLHIFSGSTALFTVI